MRVMETPLSGVKRLQPKQYGDDRGWFAELFNSARFADLGLPSSFVQDNQSLSSRGVLRGLHYQLGKPQGKLIRVLSGHIWDVAVDLRRGSAQFGQWAAFELRPLTADGELELLWIPEGFAHGFLVLSETAEVLYKTTDFYHPAGERTLLWNDPDVGIAWPLDQLGEVPPLVSAKDAIGTSLRNAELG